MAISSKTIKVESYGRPIILQDYYTKCMRCDTSIPKGIKDYCSPECELGQKKC